MTIPVADLIRTDEPCDACEHARRREAASYAPYTMYECEECGIVFAVNGSKTVDAAELYRNFYKNESGGRFNFGIEYVVRLMRLFRAFKVFTLKPKARSILDIGSGRGFMLYYLKKWFGFTRSAGTQISRPAAEFSREKLKLEIYDRDLLELPLTSPQFDVVTMWHVLEHVDKPEEYICRIREILTPSGCLLVEVPNYDSWTRKATGFYWLGLDLQYHKFFFTPRSLRRLLEKNGFRIRKIHTFSLEYSTFISAQSLVSRLTGTDQLLFQWLQGKGKSKVVGLHIALLACLAPICFLINALLYFSKHGEVLLIVATRDERS